MKVRKEKPFLLLQPPTHRLPLLPRLPRRRRRQERRPVDPPPLRRRSGRLQDPQALGPARRRIVVIQVCIVLLVFPVALVVVVDVEPLALTAAATAAEDPGRDGEGGGREGGGGAQFVEAVLEVVASVLQPRDVGAEAAFRFGKDGKKERVKGGSANVMLSTSTRVQDGT